MNLTDWLWRLDQIETGLAELPGNLPIDVLFAMRVNGVVDLGQSYRTFPFKGYIDTSIPIALRCTRRDGEAMCVDLGGQSPHVLRADLHSNALSVQDRLGRGVRFSDLGWHVVYYCGRCDKNVMPANGTFRVAIQDLDFAIRGLLGDPPPGVPNDIREVCLHCGWTTAMLWMAVTGVHPLLHAWGNSAIARNLWGLYDYFIEVSQDFRRSTQSAFAYLRAAAEAASSGTRPPAGQAIKKPVVPAREEAAQDVPLPQVRDKKARAGRRGRREVQPKEADKRNGILERWERAREAGVPSKDFCRDEDPPITAAYLKTCQEWRRQRDKHDQ